MEEAGFYLTEDNAIYYVDANGLEYHRDSSLDPATVPYVQCDQGIYYFQVAAARVQSAKQVQDVGHELEEKKYEQQDVVSEDICHDEQLVYYPNTSMDMPAADHTQSSQEGIYDYQNRAHYTTPVAACEKGQETDEYYQPNSSIDETDYDGGMEYYPQSQHEPSSHAHGDGVEEPQVHSESRRKSHNSKADEKRKKRGGRSPTPRQSTEASIESHRVGGEESQQDKKTRSRSDPTRLLATAESERPKRPTRVKSTSGLSTEEDTEDQHGKGGAKSPADSRQHAGGERRHSGKTGRRTVSRKGSRRNVMAGEDRDGERGEKSKRTSLSPARRSGSKRNMLAGARHAQSMRNLQGRDSQHGERSKGASPSPARHSSPKRNGLAGTRHAQSMRHLPAAGAGREPRRKMKPSLSKTLSRENVNKPSKDRLHELAGDNFSKANAPAKAAGRAGDRGKARAGMTRQDRASMRCLMRQHVTPANDRMPQTNKEKEPTPVEQAIAEELAKADRINTARIKELEAVVQSLQRQLTEEEHAKQATTGSATIDGILVDGKMAVNAACEAGKVAANVGLGATTLAANVGKVTAQVAVGTTSLVAKTAVGTTSLVAKTAVNTAIEARKFASNAGLAATQAATDALGLTSKAASSPLAA